MLLTNLNPNPNPNPNPNEAVGTLIPNCRNVAFEGLNHWLYLEDPARFNQLVGQFALE